MTSGEPTPDDAERELARLAADPTLHVLSLGPMTSLAVHPLEHGQIIELSIAAEHDGDTDVWLTSNHARALAHLLLIGADEADRQAHEHGGKR